MSDLYENQPNMVQALRLGHNMIYALLKRGELKGYRCGRIWRIPKAALEEYVREQSGIINKYKEIPEVLL